MNRILHPMKTNLLLLPAIALLVACGQENSSDLAKLRQEQDSLTAEKLKIDTRLAEIEHEISLKDSTRRFTLVSTLELASTNFAHYFDVVGEVQADQSINLLPETAGVIKRILVKEGDRVQAGQLLAQLDGDILQRNLDEVNTQLDLAKTLFTKQERLWQQKIGSEVQYLQAKSNKESLENRAATLRAQLANTQVKAPFAATVDRIFQKEGEMAAPQLPVLRLVDLSNIYLRADVSEAYVTRVKKGTEVILDFPSIGMQQEASISQVSQYIQPDNRTFSVRVDLKNKDGMYKPNLMANIRIQDYAKDSVIVVPNRLVQQTPEGKNFVYTFVPGEEGYGKVVKMPVEIGLSYNANTEITSGLTGKELLVDQGSRSVKDGQRVKLANN